MAAHLARLVHACDPESDADLLTRFVAARDEAAFAALVRRHGPAVYRACRHLVGPDLADDAFQATFLVLACRAASVREATSVGGWLLGTAGRVARQMRKQEHRRAAVERSQVVEPPRPAEPPDRLEAAEVGAALHDELARLPAALRDPVVLCLVEGRTQEQAAAALGDSVRTVRRRLDRAREVLKARLEGRGVVPAVAAGLVAGVGPAGAVPAELVKQVVGGAMVFLTGRAMTPAALVAQGVVSMAKFKVSAAVAAATVLVGLGIGLGGVGPISPASPDGPVAGKKTRDPDGARPGAPAGPGNAPAAEAAAQPTPGRVLSIPVGLTPAGRVKAREVQLYATRDAGKTWEQVGVVAPDKDRFEYRAPADGVYWFGPRVVFKDGTSAPGPDDGISPSLKVLVDTTPPVVRVTAVVQAGGFAVARWEVDEAHPKAGSTRLQYRPVAAGGTWVDVPLDTDRFAEARFPVGAKGPVEVRVGATDTAGNEGWSAPAVDRQPGDEAAAVRDLSARYATAARHGDPAALERLLHPDYRGARLPTPGVNEKDERTRAETVAAWTGPGRRPVVRYQTVGVRVHGPTAVETGSLFASVPFGPDGDPAATILRDVRYTRVWVKDDAGWRVFHESY